MGILNTALDDRVRANCLETADSVLDALDEILRVSELRREHGLEYDNKIAEGAYHDVIFDLNSALDHLVVLINASGRPLPIQWAMLDRRIHDKQRGLERRMVDATTWLKSP